MKVFAFVFAILAMHMGVVFACDQDGLKNCVNSVLSNFNRNDVSCGNLQNIINKGFQCFSKNSCEITDEYRQAACREAEQYNPNCQFRCDGNGAAAATASIFTAMTLMLALKA